MPTGFSRWFWTTMVFWLRSPDSALKVEPEELKLKEEDV
jgi:hypothetical protein